MSTAKLPTSSKHDDGRFQGAKITLVEGTRHPNPPPPPAQHPGYVEKDALGSGEYHSGTGTRTRSRRR